MRRISYGSALLGVGLAFGFFFGRQSATTPREAVAVVPVNSQAAPKPRPDVAQKETVAASPAPSVRLTAAQTYGWIKQGGTTLQMSPFSADGLNIELALVLGLTKEETNRLNAAVAEAKRRLEDASLRAAKGQLSADGQTLVVSVPPLPEEGGAAYAQLLDVFRRTLGEERFRLFSELTGDQLDRSFDRFGLNPVTYELTLKSANQSGENPAYPFKRYFNDAATTGSTGWSGGAISRADIEKTYPVLARYLPPTVR